MVHQTELEPARDSLCAPKAHAYTYSATGACVVIDADEFSAQLCCKPVRALLAKRNKQLSDFTTPADNFPGKLEFLSLIYLFLHIC